MAQKRMSSKAVTSTVQFTSMPAGARALYWHLNDESDEDGIVDGAMVIRMANCRNRDLDTLIENGYAIPLKGTPPKERVVYLTHWHYLNSYKHPITPSRYRDNLLLTMPDSKNRLFKAKTDNILPTGQDRSGKDRIGQVRVGEDRVGLEGKGEETRYQYDDDQYVDGFVDDEEPFK